mmetsp:Transcript_87609/g.234550  ORF Transcript_87609/g.234550 Transcript_87609/m.234550 type:complete len:284 (+) Transcript_87609:1977-2828(+)
MLSVGVLKNRVPVVALVVQHGDQLLELLLVALRAVGQHPLRREGQVNPAKGGPAGHLDSLHTFLHSQQVLDDHGHHLLRLRGLCLSVLPQGLQHVRGAPVLIPAGGLVVRAQPPGLVVLVGHDVRHILVDGRGLPAPAIQQAGLVQGSHSRDILAVREGLLQRRARGGLLVDPGHPVQLRDVRVLEEVGQGDKPVEPIGRTLVKIPVSLTSNPDAILDIIPELRQMPRQTLSLQHELLEQPSPGRGSASRQAVESWGSGAPGQCQSGGQSHGWAGRGGRIQIA